MVRPAGGQRVGDLDRLLHALTCLGADGDERRLRRSDAERQQIIKSSDVYGHYEKAIDRESAYEKLKGRAEEKLPPLKPAGRQAQSMVEAAAKSAARAIGSELGRQLLRGILGSIGGKRR